ncbi:MAG: preprotein translocase subunit YajC [Bacteroidales bacterium]|nr:preprotein translocase subunit YajC [Bacteroidales bacterium]MDD3033876.1 preprotein translocase subunit YajC [Bacteroidales bacterium]
MNFLVFLQTNAAPASTGGNWSFLIMMGLIFVVMYFFMIRPQQKKQKELVKFRSSLAKGDKVITMGGIYGVIVEVKEQYVLVEVDNNVKLRVDKGSIVKDSSDIQAAGK